MATTSRSVQLDALHSKPCLSPNAQIRRKPLVEYCTNDWQNDSGYVSSSHLEEELQSTHVSFEAWTQELGQDSSPKRKRLQNLAATALFLLLTWVLVTMATASFYNVGGLPDETVDQNSKTPTPGHTFGNNQRPEFDGVRQIAQLDTSFLPGSTVGTEARHKRLIFVGDIHGCFEELTELLSKADYNEATDHIITTGDMVNKGPFSGAVIDFLRSKRASCVRGNHDDKILLKAEEVAEAIEASSVRESDEPEIQLAMSLSTDQLAYLQSCPVILRVGEVPPHGNIVVVHGGLVPSQPLEDQDPWAVMNMRIIHPVTHIPSKEHERDGHVPWAELWDQHQSQHGTDHAASLSDQTLQDRPSEMTVIYGHDAKQGLRLRNHAKGLDSGCVKGGKLTALVLSEQPNQEIHQVNCKRYV